jgi:hypothetical protein
MHPAFTAIAAGCVLTFLAGAAQAACAPADIEIKNFKWSREAGWFTMTGELVNNCAEPAAPRIEITIRDEKNQIVSVEDAWPAGQRNLRSKEVLPFRLSTRGYATGKNVTPRVREIKQW